jgi:hypothetical protein
MAEASEIVGDSLEWVCRTEIRILSYALATEPMPLSNVPDGRGVYLLLYTGSSSPYNQIADGSRPIYLAIREKQLKRLDDQI